MFSGEIYFYWPLNSIDKLLVKHLFSLYNSNIVAVMYSRTILMAEKRIVCLISNNYYIYLKRYFEKFVTNDRLSTDSYIPI